LPGIELAVTVDRARPHLAEHVPLQERVYRQLRAAIVEGTLSSGQRLIETTLAVQLGVGRGSVREAIRRLAQEGLVTITPRRGAAVANPGCDEIDDVYVIRAALESLAARLAVQRAGPRQLKRLHRAIEQMRRASERQDWTATALADVDFHRLIIEAAGNRKLNEVFASLLDTVRRVRIGVQTGPAWSAASLGHHVDILDAIEARDEARAVALVSDHVDGARQRIMAAVAAPKALRRARGARRQPAAEQETDRLR
jgi:DNA-binding GntR family transcriptional regulator